jgi:signal transduction histidine kinase
MATAVTTEVSAPTSRQPIQARPHAGVRAPVRLFAAARGPLVDHAPVLLVILALFWLAGVAMYVHRGVGLLLEELSEVTEPATRAVADLQLALSTEGATTRAFLLTGSDGYAATFHEARASRRRAEGQLLEVARLASPAMEPIVAEISATLRVADRWLDGLYTGGVTRAEYLAEFPAQHTRFAHVTSRVAALHQLMRAEAIARHNRIQRTQRVGTLLALGGVLLGILASFSVMRLRGRERLLAAKEHGARIAAERAQAEADLHRRQVEKLAATRDRLLRGFSHDLKNPLGAANGYLFMLEQQVVGPLSVNQVQAVAKSRRSLEHAMALIETMLQLARAEATALDLHCIPTTLCDVVATVVEDYRAQAAGKGLALHLERPAGPLVVESDPDRVAQVLGNLVSNAIKYTEVGEVNVYVGTRLAGSGTPWAVVDVSDTGPGIPAEHQQRIFAEFERLGNVGTAGAGIGLAISQRIADLLGGRISVASEVGRGSTFTLWLPLPLEAR